jgi:hypothetical protein
MEESHKDYINNRLAAALIHHHIADFDVSASPDLVKSSHLKYYRLSFLFVVFIALIF